MTFLSNLFRSKSDPQKIEPLARRPLTKRSIVNEDASDDPALTEDPERQRARHRLVGALALVLIAVIGLPQILDKKPKPVANDITVQIVSNLPNPAAGLLNPEPEKKVAVEVKPDTKLDVKPEPKAVISPVPSSTPTPALQSSNATVSSAAKNLGLAPGEELVMTSKDVLVNGEVKASATGKFVIQIGAFASEERANGWVAKLKESKIPYYVLTRNNAEGVKLFILRAGPFTEREATEAAEKRIKALGLNPRIVELTKN